MIKEWNFSGECLTSKKAQTALNEYLYTHPELRDEIEKRTGTIHIEELGLPELPEHSMEECLNDSDIPSRLVIQRTLGITISKAEGDANMSELNVSAAKLGDSSGLVAATEHLGIELG
jgi:hypothetical protein